MTLNKYLCLECESWLAYLRDHGWDKCRIRAIKGEPDPTFEQIRDFEDAATAFMNHFNEMHSESFSPE